jgi:hypothetical protein
MRRAASGFEADHAALSEIWQYRYLLHHTIFDGKRPISGLPPSEYDAAPARTRVRPASVHDR